MWCDVPVARAEELAVFQGRVLDSEGKPVSGASLFVYTNTDVKRPADFISAETPQDGRFRMALPAGMYWAVARLKKGEKYGPLMPGDKHSGDPEKVELLPGAEVSKDFTVADIREAARLAKKARKDVEKIQGRIIDGKGMPVRDAYVTAWRVGNASRFPDYLSAWTDNRGTYTLYVSRGTYVIRATTHFPPDRDDSPAREILVERDKAGVDILYGRQAAESKAQGRK